MLFLFIVVCIQQIQVKNCTAVAWYFIAVAPEFVLHYYTAESGEKKVSSNNTLLHCALFRRVACALGSFSVKEYRGGLPCCAKFAVICSSN